VAAVQSGPRIGGGHSAAVVAVGNTGRCPCCDADDAGPGGRFSARVPPLGVATPDETTGCGGVSEISRLHKIALRRSVDQADARTIVQT